MRFLVIVPVSPSAAGSLTGSGISYRPDLHTARDSTLAGALSEMCPQVLVTDRPVAREVLRLWREAMPERPIAVVRLTESHGPLRRLPTMHGRATSAILPFSIPMYTVPRQPGSDGGVDEDASVFEALAVAERFAQDREQTTEPFPVTATPSGTASGRTSVLMIGGGVVNLVTARLLQAEGYEVAMVDAAPDPRAGRPWAAYGASRGGGNARMFTYTEMDDYHAKSADESACMTVFDRPPSESGWDVRGHEGEEDQQWVQDFRSVPPWLARAYNGDILGLNRRGGELWQTWMHTRPHLFDDVELRHDILRLYQDGPHLEAARHRQNAVGATVASYGAAEVRERFPALAHAAPQAFAGGIVVEGFTVNVHDFMGRLLDDLEADGARMRFDLRVEEIMRDGTSAVTGVLTADGPLVYDHYVVSPGAGNEALRRQIPSLRQVHGVLGCWATVPNVTPALGHSLKVARRGHVAEDANITVGRDDSGESVLMIGSGYGWTGGDPRNVDERKIEDIHAAVADTVETLFPDAYEKIGGRDGLRRTQRHCVRPWTASNLGIFEASAAAGGAFVVTAGHNTGGFAQAPVIAEAVSHALRGVGHPMHTLYHPLRTSRVLHAMAGLGGTTH